MTFARLWMQRDRAVRRFACRKAARSPRTRERLERFFDYAETGWGTGANIAVWAPVGMAPSIDSALCLFARPDLASFGELRDASCITSARSAACSSHFAQYSSAARRASIHEVRVRLPCARPWDASAP